MPIIKAFSEGKTIQVYKSEGWEDINNPCFDSPLDYYRIKPESEYRPYANVEEVFESVKRHGNWAKQKSAGYYHQITNIGNNDIHFGHMPSYTFASVLAYYVWADDESPLGIEEV